MGIEWRPEMKHILLTCGLFLALAGTGPAQESRATLLGTVTDPTGAVIPGVEVNSQAT
jgi:hypothetical protein